MKLSVEQCSRSDAHGHLEENHTDIARKHRISDDLRPNCQLGSNAKGRFLAYSTYNATSFAFITSIYIFYISARGSNYPNHSETPYRYNPTDLRRLQPMASILPNTQNTVGEKRPNGVSVCTADKMSSTAQATNSDKVEDHGLDTEFLIVGAGPAGAALACFLGSHGKHLGRRNSGS
jgi:hypothetical protein